MTEPRRYGLFREYSIYGAGGRGRNKIEDIYDRADLVYRKTKTGETVNGFIKKAVQERIEREGL